MGIETAITKVGTKILTQARRAYVKPVCEVRAIGETIESKIKPLAEDVVTIGNKTKTLNTSIVTKPNNLISGQEFKKQMLSLNFTGYGADKTFMESAKTAEGLFDKTYIDTYKAIQQYAERDGDLILSYDRIPYIMEFLKTKDGFSVSMQNKIIEFLKTCPEEYTKSLSNLCFDRNNSPLVKEKILDLNIRIHNEFDDIVCQHGQYFGDDFVQALVKYACEELPEKEILKRIDKLSKIADNVRGIQPFNELINSIGYVEKEYQAVQNNLVQRFLNLNIMPTESAVNQLIKGSLESRENFLKIIKPLTDFKADGLAVDKFTIENILKNEDKTVLNDIIKFIKSNKNYKKFEVSIHENSLNPNEYQIGFSNNKYSKCYMFDKNTHKMTSTMEGKIGDMTSTVSTENFVLNRNVESLNFRNDCSVIDETVVQKTKNGMPKYTEYTKESPMEGQFDVYRTLPNGKIKAIGKSFRDPITGEAIVRRNFTSPNGAKVSYNYNADKIGNYDFNYIIRNQKGDVIMNQRHAQKILGHNHYLSVVNGQKYEVKLNKHILTVTQEGQKPIKLNLKEIVKVDNPKIYDTIAQLPANEILNLKRFNVRIVKCLDEENAAYTGKEILGKCRYIEIGETTADSKFVLLHELGHLKDARISDADYEKILKVYKREVEKIRNSTTKSEQGLMEYLIDTEHYLNVKRGAIGELVADANAQKSVITDINLGDIGIRTIKAQEYLPETLAIISEVLAKV